VTAAELGHVNREQIEPLDQHDAQRVEQVHRVARGGIDRDRLGAGPARAPAMLAQARVEG
jgi:hypothetical protein